MNVEALYKAYRNASQVCTDSRAISPGCIFFALKGPSFNGNKFAKEAISKGAKFAVIDESQYNVDDNYILVDDCLDALQKLANYHIKQLNIPFIAIAGSNGKTTTKELLNAVLSEVYKTYATPGNFNNEIGVPLSLLQISNSYEIAIIEMGARKLGDIKELCNIVEPTHGIITNTGKDHLETFGTIENTLNTNAELFKYLKQAGGTAFVNIHDTDLMNKSAGINEIITYGYSSTADNKGQITQNFPYLQLSYHSNEDTIDINTQIIGKYNFLNIMAAVAIGRYFNVNNKLIKRALESYSPKNNRSQVVKKGSNTLIMDAYNANPSSMEEALTSFDEIDAKNKIVILGDMLELGEYSYDEHLLITQKLKNMALEQIVLVGEEFGKVADKLECLHFNTAEAAKSWFNTSKLEQKAILFKGSRGIALEKIIN